MGPGAEPDGVAAVTARVGDLGFSLPTEQFEVPQSWKVETQEPQSWGPWLLGDPGAGRVCSPDVGQGGKNQWMDGMG